MSILSAITELLNFIFSSYITYHRNKRLARLTDHLTILGALSKEADTKEIKEYLEQEIIDLMLLIEIGTSKKKYQQKYITIRKKCRGSLDNHVMRLFMPYTKLENNKLTFNLSPFLRQSIIAYLVIFISIAIAVCSALPLPHNIFYSIFEIAMYLLIVFVIYECVNYYSTIFLHRKDYINLIEADE